MAKHRMQKYAAAIPKLKFSILFSLVYTMNIHFAICNKYINNAINFEFKMLVLATTTKSTTKWNLGN